MWDENGKVCILAKIDASFTITYESSYGKQQMIDRITTDSTTKGRCYSELDEMPVLDIKWRGGFTFRMVFTKSDGVNEWAIYVMELLYNTGDSLFKDAVHVGKTLAKSREGSLRQFTTALDRSYLCPAGTVHTLYSSKGEPNVVLRLFNVQIQPFRVKDARFSTPQHCGQVSFGAGVLYQQDDSVIVIVGSIYILMSIGVVIGYAVYRSYFLQRPDYDTMA
ncbi:Lysosome-associated membrane glycoprotein 5 [Halotydeus destructor]|nr:Lysosome-associated membrane glycoprotein 5 [Halotydeus destructor]